MANAAQRVQERIFGKTNTPKALDNDELSPSISQERIEPPLSINIPKPHTQTTPTQPPRKNTDSPKQDREESDATTPSLQPFRERLAEKLGGEYKGAEKYRLEQDDKREKHWKRWGPYLSDRQWVSAIHLVCSLDD